MKKVTQSFTRIKLDSLNHVCAHSFRKSHFVPVYKTYKKRFQGKQKRKQIKQRLAQRKRGEAKKGVKKKA